MKYIIKFDLGEVRNSIVNVYFDYKRCIFLEMLMGETYFRIKEIE